MRSGNPAELIIGSVQLGLAYGAANRTGKPDRPTALRLVRRAADDPRVRGFDTAWAYGDSEERLGEALENRGIRTITKLSPLSELTEESSLGRIYAAVDASIEKSLRALGRKRKKLDCVLLHRAVHMTAFGGAVWKRLEHHLKNGTVKMLGVSAQSPKEALEALAHPNVQHLQLPFNVLDWRSTDVIPAVRKKPSVTVHARSVFLQGVLAANDPSVWPHVPGVNPLELIDWLNRKTTEFGRQSVADLCLAYVRGQDWIDGVVVGMETEEQLATNLDLSTRPPLAPEECADIEASRPRVPEELLDPARWPRR